MKAVAMVGWTGAGAFENLERTVVRKLAAGKEGMDRVGHTLLVPSEDPVAPARSLAFLPGVEWIAVGYRFSGTDGYLKNLELLGRRYLSRGKTFKISAQVVESKQTAGDAVLAGNSELLSSIPGARVNERNPDVRFRVAVEGTKGACGVEIRAGPGGLPTSEEWVSCLVSGGERSSAMAWMAALSGFSLRLVHSKTDEAALRRIARLYSELSFRMDPHCLQLILLDGGDDAFGRIGGWLRAHKWATFSGLRPGSPDDLTAFTERFPNLHMPLVLVQDDEIGGIYSSLRIGSASRGAAEVGQTLGAMEATRPYSEKKFGGVRADSNEVIDTLKKSG